MYPKLTMKIPELYQITSVYTLNKHLLFGSRKSFLVPLIPFFTMFPFDPPENIRKPQKTFGFLVFPGGSKGNIGKESTKVGKRT